jgi:hypothetical protein
MVSYYFGYCTVLNSNNIYFLIKIYAINFIKKIYKKYKLRKNLYLYSSFLLDKYYNPKSEYIKYLVNNFDNYNIKSFRVNRICYINNKNKLIFFKIII